MGGHGLAPASLLPTSFLLLPAQTYTKEEAEKVLLQRTSVCLLFNSRKSRFFLVQQSLPYGGDTERVFAGSGPGVYTPPNLAQAQLGDGKKNPPVSSGGKLLAFWCYTTAVLFFFFLFERNVISTHKMDQAFYTSNNNLASPIQLKYFTAQSLCERMN